MPIYDFQCSSCGHKAEVMRKISAASVDICPECGAETFSKQLSAPSFQLTGSGWYATDFKNGSKPTISEGGSKPEGESGKKSEAAPSPASCATGCACH